MTIRRFGKMVLLMMCFGLLTAAFANSENEVLIKFTRDASVSRQDSLITALGLEHVKTNKAINVHRFKVKPGYSVSEIVQLCSSVSIVEYAEPSQVVRAFASETEPAVPAIPAIPAVPAIPATPAKPAPTQAAKLAEFVPGQVIVKYKRKSERSQVSSLLQNASIHEVRSFDDINVLLCRIEDASKSVHEAVEECNAQPAIEYAEPNYIYRSSVEPNDTRWSSLYGIRQIAAPAAWDSQTGSKSIIVGVIDTGIDYNHEDLKANIWSNPGETGGGKENNNVDDDGNGYKDDYRGWNFSGNNNNPFDDNKHGSHVAGTIGAIGNNNKGVVGVCWNVTLMPLKFLDRDGSGTTADAVDAILYGTQMGAKVLSNSWGGGGKSNALQEAIEFANSNGVLFVAAAGNESSNNDKAPTYPSNYNVDNIISVASNTSSDNISGFSNYGKTTVDLSAPGSNILSSTPRNRYASLSGTSMATPHVSGAAALVWSHFPDATMDEVIIRLLGSVDRRSAYSKKVATGGRLNVAKAISSSPIIARTTKLNNTVDETGPYLVESDVIDDSAVASVKLTYQITGQSAVEVNMTNQGSHRFKGEIPGQALGISVVYFITATDDAGNSTRDGNYSFSIADGSGGGCCGKPAIDFKFENDYLRTSVNTVANISLFILPVLLIGLKRRKKQK